MAMFSINVNVYVNFFKLKELISLKYFYQYWSK